MMWWREDAGLFVLIDKFSEYQSAFYDFTVTVIIALAAAETLPAASFAQA
jgi:hypothetical protein